MSARMLKINFKFCEGSKFYLPGKLPGESSKEEMKKSFFKTLLVYIFGKQP